MGSWASAVAMIFILAMIGVLYTHYSDISMNDEMDRLYSSSGYVRIKELLEDCALVSNAYPIINFEVRHEGLSEGFCRFNIWFRDLGMSILSLKKILDIREEEIKIDYQSMLEERIKKEGLSTALVSECINKQYQWQLSAQEVFDSMFYKYLFDGRVINREFAIKSPFESYASSGGKYIVDTDCWKLKEAF